MKRCTKCKVNKELDCYTPNHGSKHSWCTACISQAIRALRAERIAGKRCVRCNVDLHWDFQLCQKHREYYRKRSRIDWHNTRNQILLAYGGTCVCCGESNTDFLTVDHINNDGGAHRRKLSKSRSSYIIYRWIIKNNYPKTLQLLCYNCNLGRAKNKGVCPHVVPIFRNTGSSNVSAIESQGNVEHVPLPKHANTKGC